MENHQNQKLNLLKILTIIILKQKIVKLISPKSKIIAVTKNFSLDYIEPLILSGHLEYGENRVQETANKWGNLIKTNNNIILHFIGKLQTKPKKRLLIVIMQVL